MVGELSNLRYEVDRVALLVSELRTELAEAMAAGQSMEGQCNDLEAERDRLRAVVEGGNLYSMLDLLEANQRLRAVVDAAQSLVAALDIGVVRDELVDLRARLVELDVSPAMALSRIGRSGRHALHAKVRAARRAKTEAGASTRISEHRLWAMSTVASPMTRWRSRSSGSGRLSATRR
jgi:hypothetical protein